MRPGDLFSVDLDRALAFGLLSSMFMIAYPRHALLVGIFVVLSAGGIELLQAMSPTPHARLDDAIVKGTGAIAGMLFASAYNVWRSIRHRNPRPTLKLIATQRDGSSGPVSMMQVPVRAKLIEPCISARKRAGSASVCTMAKSACSQAWMRVM
jgi:hypothetical protein